MQREREGEREKHISTISPLSPILMSLDLFCFTGQTEGRTQLVCTPCCQLQGMNPFFFHSDSCIQRVPRPQKTFGQNAFVTWPILVLLLEKNVSVNTECGWLVAAKSWEFLQTVWGFLWRWRGTQVSRNMVVMFFIWCSSATWTPAKLGSNSDIAPRETWIWDVQGCLRRLEYVFSGAE